MEYTDEDLRIMLEKLLEVNPDIQGGAIISVQGLPICFMLAHNTNEELVSAMSAAILTMSEHAVKELIRGDLKRVLIEGNERIIILSKVGEEYILCLLVRSEASSTLTFRTFNNRRGPPGVKDAAYVE